MTLIPYGSWVSLAFSSCTEGVGGERPHPELSSEVLDWRVALFLDPP